MTKCNTFPTQLLVPLGVEDRLLLILTVRKLNFFRETNACLPFPAWIYNPGFSPIAPEQILVRVLLLFARAILSLDLLTQLLE